MRKIISMCLLILCLGLMVFSGIAQEEEPENWYYAVKFPEGRLISFSIDGEARTLLGAEASRFGPFFEIAPNEVVTIADYDDQLHVYHITPERLRIINITALFDEPPELIPLTASYPYVVLVSAFSGVDYAVLLNVDTLQAELLPRLVSSGIVSGCCRFSADGQYLRYLGADDENAETWRLIEHTLSTGEEREVAVLPGMGFPVYQADETGTQWIYRTPDEVLLLNIDGAERILDERTEEGRMTTYWRLFGNTLYSQNLACEEDCELLYYNSEPPVGYAIPLNEPVQLIHEYGDGSLLAEIDGAAVVLKTDSPALPLGWMFSSTSFRTLFAGPLTDQHQIVVQDPALLGIKAFAMPEGENTDSYALEEGILNVTYNEYGTFLYDFRDTFLHFPIGSNDFVVFPSEEEVGINRIYSTKTELGYFASDREGLYLYDPAIDEFTTLFEGSWILMLPATLPQ